ncbi:MAG: hypothetical protein OXD48_04480, partial [Litoreibacter sp.]|nr:hypothetical protein [Litoreibacter sp.]
MPKPGAGCRKPYAYILIGGSWHGAGWTFLLWGAIHGGALVVERLCAPVARYLPRIAKWSLTFFVVHIGWVYFRAESIGDAHQVLGAMFGLLQSQADGPSHVVLTQNDVTAVWVLIAMLVAFFLPNTFQLTRDFRPIWKTVLGAVCFG